MGVPAALLLPLSVGQKQVCMLDQTPAQLFSKPLSHTHTKLDLHRYMKQYNVECTSIFLLYDTKLPLFPMLNNPSLISGKHITDPCSSFCT